ncbi:Bacterial type II secretion system protein F domain protein [Arthrobacter saudimassiliensis]|uniref:Bacterial type II secretion system protein F domain protein n=1 Tax=Arthrobacter saudimassiliensis TaxID=1461584 RepID=A0A078MS30_9MICC|nr:Bacterial type II secretion system protein F domain protein [Arthrobacter saudimassiliensis]
MALLLAAGSVVLLLPPASARQTGPSIEPDPPPGISDPALMLDLVAVMLAAGRPLGSALDVVGGLCEQTTAEGLQRLAAGLALGLAWEEAWALAAGQPAAGPVPGRPGATHALADLRYALTYAAGSGAPAARVLQAQAAQLRRRRMRSLERRAAVLGVRLVLPLGLCALPAFAALTVLPLLMSLLPNLD